MIILLYYNYNDNELYVSKQIKYIIKGDIALILSASEIPEK